MTGAELRAIRTRLQFSQRELADALSIHSQSVSDFERDVAPIPTTIALAVTHLTCAKRRQKSFPCPF